MPRWWVVIVLLLVEFGLAQEDDSKATEKPSLLRKWFNTVKDFVSGKKPEETSRDSTIPSTTNARTNFTTNATATDTLFNITRAIISGKNKSNATSSKGREAKCLPPVVPSQGTLNEIHEIVSGIFNKTVNSSRPEINWDVSFLNVSRPVITNGSRVSNTSAFDRNVSRAGKELYDLILRHSFSEHNPAESSSNRGAKCNDLTYSQSIVRSRDMLNEIQDIVSDFFNNTVNSTRSENGKSNILNVSKPVVRNISRVVNASALNKNDSRIGKELYDLVERNSSAEPHYSESNSTREAKCLPPDDGFATTISSKNLADQLFQLFSGVLNNSNVIKGTQNASRATLRNRNSDSLLRIGKDLEDLTERSNFSHEYSRNSSNETQHRGLEFRSSNKAVSGPLFTRFFGISGNHTNSTERLARYRNSEKISNNERLNRYLTFLRRHNWTYNGYARYLYNLSTAERTHRELDDPVEYFVDYDFLDSIIEGEDPNEIGHSLTKKSVYVNGTLVNSTLYRDSRKFPTSRNETNGTNASNWLPEEIEIIISDVSSGVLHDRNKSHSRSIKSNDTQRAHNGTVISEDHSVLNTTKNSTLSPKVLITDLNFNISSNKTEDGFFNKTDFHLLNSTVLKPKHSSVQHVGLWNNTKLSVSGMNGSSFRDTFVADESVEIWMRSDAEDMNWRSNDTHWSGNNTVGSEQFGEKDGSVMVTIVLGDGNGTTTRKDNGTVSEHHNITQHELNVIMRFIKGNLTENSTAESGSYNTSMGSRVDPLHPKDNSTIHLQSDENPLVPNGPKPGFNQPPFIWHPRPDEYRVFIPPHVVQGSLPHLPNGQIPPLKLLCPPTSMARCPFYIPQGMRKCYVPTDCPKAGQLCCRVECGVECVDGILLPVQPHFY